MSNKPPSSFWPFSNAATASTASTALTASTASSPGYGYTSAQGGISTGVLQYLLYLIVFIIVIMILLVVINYTLYPVFKVRPGGKGLIPIPGSNDEVLYWNNINKIATLPDTDLGTQTENWSMMLDIQLDNPTANTQLPRVLFTRGSVPTTYPTNYKEGDTILNINPNFNTIIYLDRLTNDLYVSVQTKSTDGQDTVMLESVIIPNIPVGKSIRLGVMVGSHILEVYVNGYLAKTKTYANSVAAISGSLQPPNAAITASTARVLNLRLWKRTLTAGEFRAYGASASNFPQVAVPDSCLANPGIPTDLAGIENSVSSLESYMQNYISTP